MEHLYKVCPVCESQRIRALIKKGTCYCPKCDKKYVIQELGYEIPDRSAFQESGPYVICPACASHRFRSLSDRKGACICLKCSRTFLIRETPIDICFKCKRPIIDPLATGELLGNGKYKHRRCRRTEHNEEAA
jgi:hypothetical protein